MNLTEYVCEECGKEFNNLSSLAPHIRMAHTQEGQTTLAAAVRKAGTLRTQEAKQRREPDVIQASKDYFWETRDNDLHRFTAWYKEKLDEPTN
jgi:hypothetical protein